MFLHDFEFALPGTVFLLMPGFAAVEACTIVDEVALVRGPSLCVVKSGVGRLPWFVSEDFFDEREDLGNICLVVSLLPKHVK